MVCLVHSRPAASDCVRQLGFQDDRLAVFRKERSSGETPTYRQSPQLERSVLASAIERARARDTENLTSVLLALWLREARSDLAYRDACSATLDSAVGGSGDTRAAYDRVHHNREEDDGDAHSHDEQS